MPIRAHQQAPVQHMSEEKRGLGLWCCPLVLMLVLSARRVVASLSLPTVGRIMASERQISSSFGLGLVFVVGLLVTAGSVLGWSCDL